MDVLPFTLSGYNHSDTKKNREQVAQLAVIWTKSHVIANKQLTGNAGKSAPNVANATSSPYSGQATDCYPKVFRK
jgi:hypothetical protein